MTPTLFVITLAAGSFVQGSGPDVGQTPPALTSLSLRDLPDEEGKTGGRDESSPFSILGRAEGAEVPLKISNSHNNFGLPADVLKQGVQVQETDLAGFLEGRYDLSISHPMNLRFFAGLGAEIIGSHFRVGPENVMLGDPAGVTESDFEYGLALVWEVGAEWRYRFGEGPFDLAISFDYRGGGDEAKDALSEASYHYSRYRGGIYGGYWCSEEIRAYAGVHGTDYRARLRMVDTTTFDEFTLDLRYKQVVDVAVGVELASGAVTGGVEVDFLDSLMFVVTAGIRF